MFEHHVFCTRISKHVYVRYLLLTKYDVRTRRQGVANARSEVAEAVKYTHDGIKTLFCNNKEGGKRENYDDQLFGGVRSSETDANTPLIRSRDRVIQQ